MMLSIIALNYTVRVISPASAARLADVKPAVHCRAALSKPAEIALARNGSVAFIAPGGDAHRTAAQSILVQRGDGSRLRLSLPPNELLTRVFRMYERSGGRIRFADLEFASVRLAGDGTPFATVSSHFWGAYSGVETAAFRWDGAAWRAVPPRSAMTPASDGWAVDTEVAAADTPQRAAFNGIYGRQFMPDLAHVDDPGYQLDQTEFMDGEHVVGLGAGTATALRGTTAVGFQAGLNPFGPSCERPRRTYAVKWTSGRAHRLGSGVAYDVNAKGETVGDNESLFGVPDEPVRWAGGHTFVLDRGQGSAYAIADDGTIVGRIGDAAFVADARQPNAAPTRLDDRIANRGWHILAAYGIADTGRILAVGRRRSGSVQVVVLDPQR